MPHLTLRAHHNSPRFSEHAAFGAMIRYLVRLRCCVIASGIFLMSLEHDHDGEKGGFPRAVA